MIKKIKESKSITPQEAKSKKTKNSVIKKRKKNITKGLHPNEPDHIAHKETLPLRKYGHRKDSKRTSVHHPTKKANMM